MGKYSKYQRPRAEKPREVHPVWRGIGCLMILITPVISYALAAVLIDAGVQNRWGIPRMLLGRVNFPDWVWDVPVLDALAGFIYGIDNFYALLVFFLVFLVLLLIIFSLLYSFIYGLIAPSSYSAVDAPPSRRKVKRYKR